MAAELTDDLTTHVVEPDVIAQNGRRPGTGMLALLVVLVLVVAAVMAQRRASPEVTASFSGSVLAAPPHALVAQLSTAGGLAGGMPAARLAPPLLQVYADGTAIAHASTVLRLRPTELTDLVSGLRAQLAGYGAQVAMTDRSRRVLDAPDVTLGVYDGGRLRTVTAYALGDDLGYPDRLVAARDRLAHLLLRVEENGRWYRSDTARLMVVSWVGIGPEAAPWPAGVPVPPAVPGTPDLRTADLRGARLAAALKAWPPVVGGGPGPGPYYGSFTHRLPDGAVVTARWRYLLPSERTR
jgi:hypothetical protein